MTALKRKKGNIDLLSENGSLRGGAGFPMSAGVEFVCFI
jgi:hypothetical protein